MGLASVDSKFEIEHIIFKKIYLNNIFVDLNAEKENFFHNIHLNRN